MRRSRARRRLGSTLALALVATALGGCFLDEIDKSSSWRAEKKKTPAPAPVQGSSTGKPAETNWWATAKSLGSEEPKTEIVRCVVGKSTQFMGREDCLARGGSVE